MIMSTSVNDNQKILLRQYRRVLSLMKALRYNEAMAVATTAHGLASKAKLRSARDRFAELLSVLDNVTRTTPANRRFSRRQPRQVRCGFCGENRGAPTVVVGADNAICVSCALQAANELRGKQSKSHAKHPPTRVGHGGTCSFCSQQALDVFFSNHSRAMICRPCALLATSLLSRH